VGDILGGKNIAMTTKLNGYANLSGGEVYETV
jgi:hypothetical protein